MKILCCGDLHIGRRSSRIPEDLDGPAFSCASAFDRVVDAALAESVDLVVLAGDVVDRANRFYEAFGPLERGLARLSAREIPVCAVAGNHDFDVLPRLVDNVGAERFHLLGAGGRWERRTIELASGERLHVDGWSFPREHFETSPLESYDLPPTEDALVLGLLHADTASPDSPYAPVSVARLAESAVDAWVVGHVHKPDDIPASGGAHVLVPGSVQAITSGERGAHGAWVLELDRTSRPVCRTRPVPLSSVRYDSLAVDLSGVADVEVLESTITRALRSHRDALVSESGAGALRHVACTLELVGRTPMHRDVAREARRVLDDLDLGRDGLTLRVDRVEARTRPALDIEEIARGNDPAGLLAKRLVAIERGACGGNRSNGSSDDASTAWVLDAQRAVEGIHRSKPYQFVADDPEPDEDSSRRLLLDQGYRLLDALIAQKEPA